MKFDEIKPVGNFKEILEKFTEVVNETITKCNEEKKYNKDLAKWIKVIVGDFALIEVLEEGILEKDTWDIEEAKICLLYTHLLVIDLNQTAHTYLNDKTDWDSKMVQLQEMIDSKPNIYGNLKLEE